MSGALPDFEAGQPLRAAALDVLAARVRELAARRGALSGSRHGRRMVVPGRRYAFQLASDAGVIYCRQGWLDVGNGQLVPVGAAEWNAVGALRPCTVWLEIDGPGGGRVVASEYDVSTPETNVRRRLGYVRAVGASLYCIQVLGGVVCPAAPRRMMGVAALAPGTGEPETFGALDSSWHYCHAGGVTGKVQEKEGAEAVAGRCVPLGYACEMGTLALPPERGGQRLALQMGFNCAI